MPKSTQRWRTNLSSSSKVSWSRSRWMRSRAVSLPVWCSRSRRSGPPPASASASRRRRSSVRSWCAARAGELAFLSGKGSSRGRRCRFRKNADGEVVGKPHGAEKQNDAEDQFRRDGHGPMERGRNGSDIDRRAYEREHRAESHGHNQNRGQNGGKDHFHGSGNPRCKLCIRTRKHSASESKSEREKTAIIEREFSATPTSRRRPGWSRWDLPGRT